MPRLATEFIRYFCILKMTGNSIIRSLTGILLICTFAIGITPKSAFHELIASHNDGCFDNHQYKETQITRQGFSCHFENLVVESPYIWQPQTINAPIIHFFTSFQSSLKVNWFSHHSYYSELRGPPYLI